MEILKERGVHDYGILRAWGGVTHFGISEGKGNTLLHMGQRKLKIPPYFPIFSCNYT